MKPKNESKKLLGITHSKSKMFEYQVADEDHIQIRQDPAYLFRLTISILGDLTAAINSKDPHLETILELQDNLLFAAQFFDAYLQSMLDEQLDAYLLLIGSASYYLCDLPGSSIVLASKLPEKAPDLECLNIENLLFWIIQSDFSSALSIKSSVYKEYINTLSELLVTYYQSGSDEEKIAEYCDNFRSFTYEIGTARQLLFTDIVCALIRKHIDVSCWKLLPIYSNLNIHIWSGVLKKSTFIKDFWPAQILLGEQGIFNGKSAVVQMPTSAGKTKSIEVIIRSSFLAKRTSLAIIVAPFRSLCQQIYTDLSAAFLGENIKIDEPTDVLQMDFDISELLQSAEKNTFKKIMILTPEKLLYILRHEPELSDEVGLLIYDEGHQFDNGSRGITYELLLSSLKMSISKNAQSILISAVISNADNIGHWLNGKNSNVISSSDLLPAYRTLAFASWQDTLGRVEYVDNNNPDKDCYFVPRVIEQYTLTLKGKETKERSFPEKNNGQDIALYFGIKLIGNGSVAIFCGTKISVNSICKRIVEIYDRDFPSPSPLNEANKGEVNKLYHLHVSHFGEEYTLTRSAKLGLFSHSGNLTQGLRLAVEYAMQHEHINFIVCTSTLAQGVNLPIRYLIITSIYQAAAKIKTRDFHNLLGRAGRAGKHTEGTILFSDPEVYDKKNMMGKSWRWRLVKNILNPQNSEPCASTLLSVFEPFKSDNDKQFIEMDTLTFVNFYLEHPDNYSNLILENILKNSGFSENNLVRQIKWKMNIITTIESFLMAHWNENEKNAEDVFDKLVISNLAKETLAYYLASKEDRKNIVDLFVLLAGNIFRNLKTSDLRKIFSKTLFGVHESKNINIWVIENIKKIQSSNNELELLEILWPQINKYINNKNYNKCNPSLNVNNFIINWVNGFTYLNILKSLKKNKIKLIAGTQKREVKIENIVEFTENAVAHESTLILSAITEMVIYIDQNKNPKIVESLRTLQKKLKYGLPDRLSVILYELGFSDRVIAQELSNFIGNKTDKFQVISYLKKNENDAKEFLAKFPFYYTSVLGKIIHSNN